MAEGKQRDIILKITSQLRGPINDDPNKFVLFFSKHKLPIIVGIPALALAIPLSMLAFPDGSYRSYSIGDTPQPNAKNPTDPKAKDIIPQPQQNTSSTSISINNDTISIPQNGEFHKTIQDQSGTTEINTSSRNSSTTDGNGSNSNTRSVDININNIRSP